ncbi:hypothetical protein F0225_10220 [Vibrio pectenicida]|uniref:Uncharacterized protein n=1 Tax=Vibrio pectenicida TaxID=62763 RepID=A0A7Y4A080_9VIBR|nr:hypothetical protein [Vibrio pectenicida]NOH71709.1 hypothetical protein [Vibrio pectenicida]
MITFELNDLNIMLPFLAERCHVSDTALRYENRLFPIETVQPVMTDFEQSGQLQSIETHFHVLLRSGITLVFPLSSGKPMITAHVMDTLDSIAPMPTYL